MPTVVATPRDYLSPFVVFHRARRLSAFGRVLAVGFPLAAVVAGMCMVGSFAAAPASAATSATLAAIDSSPPAPPTPSVTPSHVVAPVVTAPAAPAAPHASVAPVVRIAITAKGYQTQLDECQWVRMDLGAEAPIVGAHTRCGGSVVLTMGLGEVVELDGQGLSGRYVVTDSRDAHAGDVASTATVGMQARVILQTCYPGNRGHERLVGLEPQN
jgi:hypothetical protein